MLFHTSNVNDTNLKNLIYSSPTIIFWLASKHLTQFASFLSDCLICTNLHVTHNTSMLTERKARSSGQVSANQRDVCSKLKTFQFKNRKQETINYVLIVLGTLNSQTDRFIRRCSKENGKFRIRVGLLSSRLSLSGWVKGIFIN